MTNPFAGTEGASSHTETISSSQSQNSQGTHHGVENTSGTSDSTMESTTTTVTTPSKFKQYLIDRENARKKKEAEKAQTAIVGTPEQIQQLINLNSQLAQPYTIKGAYLL